jgi:hypothetical protein
MLIYPMHESLWLLSSPTHPQKDFPDSSLSECHAPSPSTSNIRFRLADILCQQLLDHMRESMVYSEADLGPFQKRLAELRQIVQNDAANHPPAMIQLLERKLNQCGTSSVL